jgi:drug/metabolite transporter (DMT)-like permease
VRHVPALEASVLLLLEPALNPVWAWLVHGETPGPWSILGGVLILGATLARTFVDAREERRLGKAASPVDRSEGLPADRE